jgi:hypothetical protein
MEDQADIKKSETTQNEVNPVKKQKRWSTYIREVIIGDFLSSGIFFNNIPYLIFIAIIALVYISNTYYAEKTFRQIEKTKTELKELRFQYISAKSNLMYYSKLSEISKRVQMLGLKETTKPPYKIFYNNDSLATRKSVD